MAGQKSFNPMTRRTTSNPGKRLTSFLRQTFRRGIRLAHDRNRSAAEPQPKRIAVILPAAAPDPVGRESVTSAFALGTRCGLQGRGPQKSLGSRQFGQILREFRHRVGRTKTLSHMRQSFVVAQAERDQATVDGAVAL